ncbi:WS/DGAT domain-containing protein [Nocardia cyriacigeorgica]|uniref:WS/DGAT domain-containing protein n=1 Tax=Nocardia cyriacigeorgica TaxID=135487 RepID=UPI002455D6A6|nr:WS/DGAT domain-containing protein [Nocardia cyriacigeorgica]
MSKVEPQDATMYWLSRRTRNDLFLLYCFAESELSTDRLRATIAHRSATIPDLCLRLRPAPRDLSYPTWVPCAFDPSQFVEHRLPQADWTHLEHALGEVLATGVDAAERPWRLHVFRGIAGAPLSSAGEGALSAAPDRVTVAVLQMSHALADGKRAADLARALFSPWPAVPDTTVAAGPDELAGASRTAGDSPETARTRPSVGVAKSVAGACGNSSGAPVGAAGSARRPRAVSTATELFRTAADAVRLGSAVAAIPVRMARTVAGGISAFRAQRELAKLTEAGELPEAGGGFAPSLLNGPGEVGGHRLRMIVCQAEQLRAPGFSVTVLALTAVSIALERYLERHAALLDRLGAQVPMALPHPALLRDVGLVRRAVTAVGALAQPRNNYRSLGVDLFADEPDPRRRAERIAAELAARRTRAVHPLLSVQDRVTASLPAPILRRDVDRYPIDTIPDALAGHTVVSSVYRGPADLTFGDAPVLFTAGFPALGAVMHLTHGVHGLGDTVTISVHADPATIPDLDCYADLLRAALDEVSTRVREPDSGPAAG